MAWQAHRVVFRLRSPLHIGCGKVGNLQRTRPYVTGRVLWGALTERLTRDAAHGRGPATDSQEYLDIGGKVHGTLAYTYFYPATKSRDYQIAWPWENESQFRRRFLSSYSGTALSYPQQSAATGMLREVEFISPHTLNTGEPVFLIGYLFEKEGCKLPWRDALKRLQIGGERGYGWGDLELSDNRPVGEKLFDGPKSPNGKATFNGEREPPIISLMGAPTSPAHLLAHCSATKFHGAGEVEPLVGREWRSHQPPNRYAGQHVQFGGVFLTPGGTIDRQTDFQIGEFGLWQVI